jgi:hypothetical protein
MVGLGGMAAETTTAPEAVTVIRRSGENGQQKKDAAGQVVTVIRRSGKRAAGFLGHSFGL